MIRCKPPLLRYLLPPGLIPLITRHDDMCNHDPFFLEYLVLHFLDTSCDDGDRCKTVRQWQIVTVIDEVRMPDVDAYVL